MAKQKKITKEELKHDPLLDSVVQVQNFYEENKNNITYSVIGVVVVALLATFIVNMRESVRLESSALLGKAQLEIEAVNYEKAKVYLTDLLENYGDSEAGVQAELILANVLYNQENYAEAKSHFQKFVNAGVKNNILTASAHAGIAACEEIEKAYDAAAKGYIKAYELTKDIDQGAEYLYLAGLNYKNADMKDEASKQFQLIIDSFPESSYKFNAESQKILLSGM